MKELIKKLNEQEDSTDDLRYKTGVAFARHAIQDFMKDKLKQIDDEIAGLKKTTPQKDHLKAVVKGLIAGLEKSKQIFEE